MMISKLLKILFGLLILFVVVVGLTSIKHPIILKWATGSAKHHGSSMPAKVYTNGQVNNDIKVFYTDEAKNYLLSFLEYDSIGLNFINIDLIEKRIGVPVNTSKQDYDIIVGHLFESKTRERFTSFQDSVIGFNFDPQLSITGKQIKFKMPPNKLQLDSVRLLVP